MNFRFLRPFHNFWFSVLDLWESYFATTQIALKNLQNCQVYVVSFIFGEKKVTLMQGFFPKVRKNLTDAFDFLIAEERLIVE